jgi:hypothetical protein
MKDHECQSNEIEWDDKPDYEGCHGMCIRWFGTCLICNRRVYDLWEPKGVFDCETNKEV